MSVEKNEFIVQLKKRIMNWVIRILDLCEAMPESVSTRVITYQLAKSATSVGANHRAACVSRSSNEFYAKMCIAVEEADESEYWLEIIKQKKISINMEELTWLQSENNELTRILAAAKKNAYRQ